ncbi:TPA: hypothetical protein N0F65_012770 [Lagenidium giganteum]|uniref:Sodium/hydrogen exchanger n=1 Tax=Lagenidium giganteum TaxID=4803 RepID=A0AAV2YAB7_9STRA|nr:TPA: hypothetical protein N0F65_012770 [Lagenidium giganteum]
MEELPHENDLVERHGGATDEIQLAVFFTFFLVLVLGSILVSNKVSHHWHCKTLPEAAAIILVGIIGGWACKLHGGPIAKSLTVFDPHTFFIVLLPPIIFNSGYTMKRRFFFENIKSILSFAILGTFISNVVVGVLLYAVGKIGWSVRLSIAEGMAFGALISATDPVSTLAIFQELRVDPTLFYIVFGESVLNDAVGIVLFTTFAKFVGYVYTPMSTVFALLDFVLIFVGSTLVGVFFGVLSALLFKHFDFKDCVLHEVGVYVTFSYLPFVASTAMDMSGVVSILFAGIAMKHYSHNNISMKARELCSKMFSTMAHLTEATVFLNLGLCVFSVQHGYHFGLIFWALLFCFIGRAAHVYPLSAWLNRSLKVPITANQQHMLWFSGLRGAVAFALASSFPGEHREDIVATTMVIVLVTVFAMGGGTVAMLDRLKIVRLTPEEEQALDKAVRPAERMQLLQFDDMYITPLLLRDPEKPARKVIPRFGDTGTDGDNANSSSSAEST